MRKYNIDYDKGFSDGYQHAIDIEVKIRPGVEIRLEKLLKKAQEDLNKRYAQGFQDGAKFKKGKSILKSILRHRDQLEQECLELEEKIKNLKSKVGA